jgi:hypothetical protein
VFVLFVQNL